ncbi:hypothetical protein ACOM2C_12980 [Pseudarthrobacter sp. So.54]
MIIDEWERRVAAAVIAKRADVFWLHHQEQKFAAGTLWRPRWSPTAAARCATALERSAAPQGP